MRVFYFLLLFLLGGGCSTPALPVSELHEEEWRGQRTFQAGGDLYLASSGSRARRAAQRIEHLEEVIREAPGASTELDALLAQPGLVIVVGLEDELFGESAEEHSAALQSLSRMSLASEGEGGERPPMTSMWVGGDAEELTPENKMLMARSMRAHVSLDSNTLGIPDSLVETCFWCCILPNPSVEDELRSNIIRAQLARVSFAKRAAMRMALPLLGSRLRREFRRAFYPLHAVARLAGTRLRPEEQMRLLKQIKQLPRDVFDDPN